MGTGHHRSSRAQQSTIGVLVPGGPGPILGVVGPRQNGASGQRTTAGRIIACVARIHVDCCQQPSHVLSEPGHRLNRCPPCDPSAPRSAVCQQERRTFKGKVRRRGRAAPAPPPHPRAAALPALQEQCPPWRGARVGTVTRSGGRLGRCTALLACVRTAHLLRHTCLDRGRRLPAPAPLPSPPTPPRQPSPPAPLPTGSSSPRSSAARLRKEQGTHGRSLSPTRRFDSAMYSCGQRHLQYRRSPHLQIVSLLRKEKDRLSWSTNRPSSFIQVSDRQLALMISQ